MVWFVHARKFQIKIHAEHIICKYHALNTVVLSIENDTNIIKDIAKVSIKITSKQRAVGLA